MLLTDEILLFGFPPLTGTRVEMVNKMCVLSHRVVLKQQIGKHTPCKLNDPNGQLCLKNRPVFHSTKPPNSAVIRLMSLMGSVELHFSGGQRFNRNC